jgi:hypothetical protein
MIRTVTPQKSDLNILKATTRVAQVSRSGGPLELVERPIPDPGPGSVRERGRVGLRHRDSSQEKRGGATIFAVTRRSETFSSAGTWLQSL